MGHILEISAPSHRNELCQGIGRLLDSEEVGSDFEFKWADSKPIKAHFFVLQIFCRVLQNSNCRRICFESAEIQREDVRCLLEFIYRGKTQVEVGRLDAVKRAAVKLRLQTFLDLVEGKQIKSVEIENETDTENEEEVCESLAEDEDIVKVEDSNSVDRDYTESSEEEEEHKSNVGKQEKNGVIRKHLAPRNYDLRSYQSGNQNPDLATKHQKDSNGQVLEKRVKCDQCQFTCAAEVLLKTHIKSAHCETDKDKLKRRKRSTRSNVSDHACGICGWKTFAADNLRIHEKVHSEKVDCEICGKKFSLNSVHRHRKTHEVKQKMKRFSCIICAFRTRNRLNLKEHLKNIHHMSEKKIVSLFNSHAGYKI